MLGAWVKRKWGNGYEVSFWGNEHILKLTVVMAAQFCTTRSCGNNPHELLGPPNAIVLTVLSITEKIVKGVQSWKIKDLGSEREKSWKLQSHTKIQDGKGNGNPLQCSCLENLRDGGAWWAAVYGVTQSWTRLKRLSSSITYFNLFSNQEVSLYQEKLNLSFFSG